MEASSDDTQHYQSDRTTQNKRTADSYEPSHCVRLVASFACRRKQPQRMKLEKAPNYWASGKPATPKGICLHDTGSPSTSNPANLIRLLTDGLTQRGGKKLPPPIYTYLVTGDDRVIQIADESIKTNHAGRVVGGVLDRVASRQPIAAPPTARGGSNGNRTLIGVALQRTGAQPVAPQQLQNCLNILEQICRRWGFDPLTQIVSHNELTSRKIDPQRLDMNWLRQQVRLQVDSKPRDHVQPVAAMAVLRRGVVSESVGKVQDVLIKLRVLAPVGKHRCHYGPKTERAVRTFQALMNLPNTGIIDQATWDSLRAQKTRLTGKPRTRSGPEPPLQDTEIMEIRWLLPKLRKKYGYE